MMLTQSGGYQPFGEEVSDWASFDTSSAFAPSAAKDIFNQPKPKPAPVAPASSGSGSKPSHAHASSSSTSSAAAPSSAAKSRIPPRIDPNIDPFSEAVFPVPQTPPKVKPRPSQSQQQQQQQQQQPQPMTSPTAKKCAVSGCDNLRFARGYCALHLSDVASRGGDAAIPGVIPTPTSRIRNTYNLWFKDFRADKDSFTTDCTWILIHNDDQHTIKLHDNTFVGLRTVSINGKEVFNGNPDSGSWKLDATIGNKTKSNLNLKVVVVPGPKGYEYELYVDDLPFEEAHQAFLSKLSSQSVMQKLSLADKAATNPNAKLTLAKIQEAQLADNLYIKQNWNSLSEDEKSSLGLAKSKVSWSFTIKGKKHVCVLEYSHTSGKKKVSLDGAVLKEKRPSLLATNKHKRWSFHFKLEGVDCEVRTAKNKAYAGHSKDPEASPGSEDPQTAASRRPFLFNFSLDSVPFEACLQTESDLAGGNILLDSKAKQVAAQKAAAASSGPSASGVAVGGRRNSVHKPLSAEEYEAAMREEAEADRRAAEMQKQQRAQKATGSGSKQKKRDQSSSSEQSSSEEDD